MSYSIDYFAPRAIENIKGKLEFYSKVEGNKVGNGVDEDFVISYQLEEGVRGYIVTEEAINYVKQCIIQMKVEGYEVYF